MLRKLLKWSPVALIALAVLAYVFKDKLVSFVPTSLREEKEEDERGEKAEIEGAIKYYNLLRADLRTGQVDPAAVIQAQQSLANYNHRNKLGNWLKWTEMGPDNVGGRCRAIVIDRDSQNIVYAGGVSGGFWVSRSGGASWSRPAGAADFTNVNNVVCSMTQGADRAIYYGTGEAGFVALTGGLNSGFYGGGVFKSTDRGRTFKRLNPTDPATNSDWLDVHAMASDPSDAGRIYAGTDGGLYYTNDGGTTWKKANINGGLKYCKDIKLSADGNTIYAVTAFGTNCYVFRADSKAEPLTFKRIGSGTTGMSASSSSMVLAIAASDENVIYVSSTAANNTYGALYRSGDKGQTWDAIASGDQAFFNPVAMQGFYDNCVAVDPKNANHVIFGGLNLWSAGKINDKWQVNQLTNWSTEFLGLSHMVNPYYVHADQHVLLFDKSSPNPNLYIGCDGGIFKSSDFTYAENPTFFRADFGFNTVQFYNIATSVDTFNEVIGGTQDNGTIRVAQGGITLQNGVDFAGGDGFHAEISKVNPLVYMYENYNGTLHRTFNKGGSAATFDGPYTAGSGSFPFNTAFHLWESSNDQNSTDTAVFKADKNYTVGTKVDVKSRYGVNIKYVLPRSLNIGDTVNVKDIVQSRFYFAPYGEIWMTRDAILAIKPTWFRIAAIPGIYVLDMASSADGNDLFVAGVQGNNGVVWRISGLSGKTYEYLKDKSGKDSVFVPSMIGITQTEILPGSGMVGQAATSVGVDPSDANHILVSFGSYGSFASNVYHSFNALAASPTFTSVQSNLPFKAPIYSAMINMTDPKNYLIGTEYGLWASRDQGSSWQEENQGLDRVPVFSLRQNTFPDTKHPNPGPVFYVGTHGRGVFMSTTLASYLGVREPESPVANTGFLIYPNPASSYANLSFELPKASDISIMVMDLRGRQVKALSQRAAQGDNLVRLETSDLAAGTYFVHIQAGNVEKTAKLLKVY